MAESGGQTKTEKATPKKRRDERREGHVVLSKDVVSVVFLVGIFCSMRLLFPGIAESASYFMSNMIGIAGSAPEVSMGMLQKTGYEFVYTAARCLIPLLLISMMLGIVSTGVQTKFLFAKKSLRPRLKRLNPLQGIKKLFSLKNLVELLKSMLKIIIMIVLVYTVLKADFVSIVKTMDMDIRISTVYVLKLMLELVLKICFVFMFIAMFDYMFQKWEYERSIRMTKHEVKEEFKQMEGNPQIKGKIRDIQRQRARTRMMQAVPEADVIIKNPTHFAVALRYDIEKDRAPVLLAKGQDELALRIISTGEEHQVTIVENKPLARGIFATTELEQEIPAEYYSAVAEVLVYVYKLNKRDGVSKQ